MHFEGNAPCSVWFTTPTHDLEIEQLLEWAGIKRDVVDDFSPLHSSWRRAAMAAILNFGRDPREEPDLIRDVARYFEPRKAVENRLKLGLGKEDISWTPMRMAERYLKTRLNHVPPSMSLRGHIGPTVFGSSSPSRYSSRPYGSPLKAPQTSKQIGGRFSPYSPRRTQIRTTGALTSSSPTVKEDEVGILMSIEGAGDNKTPRDVGYGGGSNDETASEEEL